MILVTGMDRSLHVCKDLKFKPHQRYNPTENTAVNMKHDYEQLAAADESQVTITDSNSK